MSDITTILMMLLTIYGLAAAVFLLAGHWNDFERDLADCTVFDAAAYEKRHATLRFRDSVARLLSPLL